MMHFESGFATLDSILKNISKIDETDADLSCLRDLDQYLERQQQPTEQITPSQNKQYRLRFKLTTEKPQKMSTISKGSKKIKNRYYIKLQRIERHNYTHDVENDDLTPIMSHLREDIKKIRNNKDQRKNEIVNELRKKILKSMTITECCNHQNVIDRSPIGSLVATRNVKKQRKTVSFNTKPPTMFSYGYRLRIINKDSSISCCEEKYSELSSLSGTVYNSSLDSSFDFDEATSMSEIFKETKVLPVVKSGQSDHLDRINAAFEKIENLLNLNGVQSKSECVLSKTFISFINTISWVLDNNVF